MTDNDNTELMVSTTRCQTARAGSTQSAVSFLRGARRSKLRHESAKLSFTESLRERFEGCPVSDPSYAYKMLTDEAYKKAITRNLYEVAQARLERQVLVRIEEYDQKNGILVTAENFFSIAYRGLFYSLIAHAIKVLDRNLGSATFWTIFEKDPSRVKQLKSYFHSKINFLKALAAKLKRIRDKTHFHIDKFEVLDARKVWDAAGVTGIELEHGLKYLWEILEELHKAVTGREFFDPTKGYDGNDVLQILEHAHSEGFFLHRGETPVSKIVH